MRALLRMCCTAANGLHYMHTQIIGYPGMFSLFFQFSLFLSCTFHNRLIRHFFLHISAAFLHNLQLFHVHSISFLSCSATFCILHFCSNPQSSVFVHPFLRPFLCRQYPSFGKSHLLRIIPATHPFLAASAGLFSGLAIKLLTEQHAIYSHFSMQPCRGQRHSSLISLHSPFFRLIPSSNYLRTYAVLRKLIHTKKLSHATYNVRKYCVEYRIEIFNFRYHMASFTGEIFIFAYG